MPRPKPRKPTGTKKKTGKRTDRRSRRNRLSEKVIQIIEDFVAGAKKGNRTIDFDDLTVAIYLESGKILSPITFRRYIRELRGTRLKIKSGIIPISVNQQRIKSRVEALAIHRTIKDFSKTPWKFSSGKASMLEAAFRETGRQPGRRIFSGEYGVTSKAEFDNIWNRIIDHYRKFLP